MDEVGEHQPLQPLSLLPLLAAGREGGRVRWDLCTDAAVNLVWGVQPGARLKHHQQVDVGKTALLVGVR